MKLNRNGKWRESNACNGYLACQIRNSGFYNANVLTVQVQKYAIAIALAGWQIHTMTCLISTNARINISFGANQIKSNKLKTLLPECAQNCYRVWNNYYNVEWHVKAVTALLKERDRHVDRQTHKLINIIIWCRKEYEEIRDGVEDKIKIKSF